MVKKVVNSVMESVTAMWRRRLAGFSWTQAIAFGALGSALSRPAFARPVLTCLLSRHQPVWLDLLLTTYHVHNLGWQTVAHCLEQILGWNNIVLKEN